MSEFDLDRLVFHAHPVDDEGIEILEVRDEDEPGQTIYSCVALYRRNWRPDWPALGGNRWLQAKPGEATTTPAMARREASSLALAMFMKNNLIRKAELALEHREHFLFGWQGGKGVIWTPWDGGGAEANRRHLTPRRLMAQGMLIERLSGDFIGSKDAGISGSELRWMERATSFTIGNGCRRDTGEGTAHGVHSGMLTTLELLGKGVDEPRKLADIPVLVCGLGKVGLPLLQILHEDGAILSIWEPALAGTTDADLHNFYEHARDGGAAIEAKHLATLLALRHRIFSSDLEAMETATRSARGVSLICPAGSRIEWLSETLDSRRRYEILAARADAADCIILGPANDQLPLGSHDGTERDRVLGRLSDSGTRFVPDPVVSPGGVIAVSHELTAEWKADQVNKDARQIVDKSLRLLFERTDDTRSSKSIYQAFERLALD